MKTLFYYLIDNKMDTNPRGLLILAPMGSGKSYFVQHANNPRIVDGDDILRKHNVPNKNYYWYPSFSFNRETQDLEANNENERQFITATLDYYVNKGYIVLYSGNPTRMNFDYLVYIDPTTRWNNLSERGKRGEWTPDTDQFNREEQVYSRYLPTTKSGFYQHDKTLFSFNMIPL